MDSEATATADVADPNDPGNAVAAPPRRRVSWLAATAIGLAILLLSVAIAGFVIRVPYTTIAPGEALSLRSRVKIDGKLADADQRGDIRLLFVREAGHVNVWQYVRARLDSDIDLVKDAAANPGKLTSKQYSDQGLQQMADAKNDATAVALRAAGHEVGIAPGLTVSDLAPDLPAIKVLYWGDVILKADGKVVTKASDLTEAIAKDRVGGYVTLDIKRDGEAKTVRVPIASQQGRKIIGVVVSPRFKFPIKVSVDTTGIGGPSAGLAMTLAILDDLTPGDLTGGKNVAVTGTIDAIGDVGEIGGIDQKAVAARAAGVSLFIVPQCSPNDPPGYLAACQADLKRASKRAGSGIKVVPVATFAQALKALRAAGGAPVKTSEPTTSTTTAV
jgi:PDZ domain-containing protein